MNFWPNIFSLSLITFLTFAAIFLAFRLKIVVQKSKSDAYLTTLLGLLVVGFYGTSLYILANRYINLSPRPGENFPLSFSWVAFGVGLFFLFQFFRMIFSRKNYK